MVREISRDPFRNGMRRPKVLRICEACLDSGLNPERILNHESTWRSTFCDHKILWFRQKCLLSKNQENFEKEHPILSGVLEIFLIPKNLLVKRPHMLGSLAEVGLAPFWPDK